MWSRYEKRSFLKQQLLFACDANAACAALQRSVRPRASPTGVARISLTDMDEVLLASAAASSARTRAESLPQHALCITGLQRSYPEFALNVRASLANLYTGREGEVAGDEGEASRTALRGAVTFFGVRPANDSWHAVRATLPPLAGEAIQAPCGIATPEWFTAYSRSWEQRRQFMRSFVQMMCDFRQCLRLIEQHEATSRRGHPFTTLARLRLDRTPRLVRQLPFELTVHTLPSQSSLTVTS